tara:strand:- start:131 stop:775 length:645 start_codon:yes stop_codon:yes gene_type:complete
MAKSIDPAIFSLKFRPDKIKKLTSISQLKDEEGFTLVELIVVVMMIGILSSIAIPQFMTSADKAKQKEATGIVSAMIKGATAYQVEYGSLPTDASELSEYAVFQRCTAADADIVARGGAVCKTNPPAIGPVSGTATEFFATSGNYRVEFQMNPGQTLSSGGTGDLFQVRANPTGGAFLNNGSAVMGCYNPTDGTSEVYEHRANDKGPQTTWRIC